MIASDQNNARSDKPDVLNQVVTRVLAAGATEFEVKDEDGRERVSIMKGPVGFGIASFPADSQEATELRRRFYALLEKPGKITIQGVDYVLQVETRDSFEEDAFRVKIKPVKAQGIPAPFEQPPSNP